MSCFNTTRRRAAWHATLALLACLAAPLGWAQTTPIRVLVGFPAGGGTDAIARILADKLKDPLGVPIVVENRGGAGGLIAAQALGHAQSRYRQVLRRAGQGVDPARCA